MKSISPVDKPEPMIESYDKIVAFYHSGVNPQVLVADPQLAKNVLIRDFDKFIDRLIFLKYLHPSSL